jgi:hypothetical protein
MLKAKDRFEIIGVKNLTTNSSYLDLNLSMFNPTKDRSQCRDLGILNPLQHLTSILFHSP